MAAASFMYSTCCRLRGAGQGWLRRWCNGKSVGVGGAFTSVGEYKWEERLPGIGWV